MNSIAMDNPELSIHEKDSGSLPTVARHLPSMTPCLPHECGGRDIPGYDRATGREKVGAQQLSIRQGLGE